MVKTNVMRVLEREKIAYTPHEYAHGGEAVDAVTAAGLLGADVSVVYKTLVTRGAHDLFVFVIPGAAELDLKKAAKAVGEKSVEMIHVSELPGLTGYVRGGCSPVGMKKAFRTTFDQSALAHPAIYVSAGKIGVQVEAAPRDLAAAAGGSFADLTV